MKTLTVILALVGLLSPVQAPAQTAKLRVGICARTVSMGVGSPFAVAMKMGWFKQEGQDVEVVTLPSVEPLASVRPQGIKAKIFYTAYETNGYGLAVPADITSGVLARPPSLPSVTHANTAV